MQLNNCVLSVIINNHPITEYQFRGNIFIEGREGSNYELQFTNNNPYCVEAVISVDGLSIIDGKPASQATSSGYLVNSGETISIPGWKVDSSTAAQFAFSGKSNSYATGATGSSQNNGVIGVTVYREKERRYNTYSASNGLARGIGIVASGADALFDSGSSKASYKNSSLAKAAEYMENSMAARACVSSVAETPVEQHLGTAFGESTLFKTREEKFSRGDLIATLIAYYDSRSNLIKRGVPVGRTVPSLPNAFPADDVGCKPPVGWKK